MIAGARVRRAWAAAALVLLACSGPVAAEPLLRGRVLEAGSPVAGAEVSVVALDIAWKPRPVHAGELPLDAVLASAACGEDGGFAIDAAAIPAGLHVLAIRKPGGTTFLRHRERIAFGGSALPGDLDLALPATAEARGLALDETGAPAPKVPLTAWLVSGEGVLVARTESDEAGRFTLAVPRGGVVTLIGRDALRFGIARLPVPPSGEVPLAVHLSRFELVEGSATSVRTGRPEQGLRVRALLPSWDPVAPTGAELQYPPWGDADVVADVVTGSSGAYAVRVPPQGMVMSTGPESVAMRLGHGRSRIQPGTSVRGVVRDASGAAVPDADVRWTELPGGVKTDAKGGFRLLPDVNAAVAVTTREGAVETVPDPPSEATLLVPRSRRLRVSVVRRSAGGAEIPAGGVTVRFRTAAWDTLTVTGGDGIAELPVRGRIAVSARDGVLAAEGIARPDEAAIGLALAEERGPRPRASRTIRIACTGSDGRPLEGAIARALPMGALQDDDAIPPAAATGAGGIAVVVVPDGRPSAVLVSRPGHAPLWLMEVLPGASVSARLPRGAVLRCTVTDAAGLPVAGAAIIAKEERSSAPAGLPSYGTRGGASTDSAGRAEIRDLTPGALLVEAIADSHATPPSQRVTAAEGQVVTLGFVLPAGATLRGLVRDAAGPIAGAHVEAQMQDPRSLLVQDAAASLPRHAYTGDDGTFEIEGLDGDSWYAVSADAEWHAPAHGGARPSESRLELEMTATGRIDGTVQGESTLLGVTCRRADGGEGDASRPSAPETLHASGYSEIRNGAFLVEPLYPGTYECEAEGPAHAARAEGIAVRAGIASTVTLVPRTRPTLLVSVVDADTGLPIAGAHVRSARSEEETDEDGRARVPLARPAEEPAEGDDDGGGLARKREREEHEAGALIVMAEGHRISRSAIPSPPPAALTVRLQALPELQGRVIDGASVAAPHVQVRMDGMGDPVLADGEGRFRIRVADEGGDVVAWRSAAGILEEARVTLEPGAPLPPELVLTLQRVETCELVVTVQDAAGPVAGAAVIVSGGDMSMGTTDAQGRFTASGLRPGPASLMVEAPSGQARRTVRLSPGEPARETVILGGGWTVEGRAVRGGQPVEGAFVQAMEDYEARDVTHVDGAFRLTGIPDETDVLRIVVSDPVTGFHRNVEARRGAGPLTIDLTAVSLTGRVVASGRPVDSAFVMIDCAGERAAADVEDDGTFLLEGLAPGLPCELLVTAAAEQMPSLPLRVATPSSGREDLGDLEMQAALLQGSVDLAPGMGDGLVFGLATADGLPAGSVRVRPDDEGFFSVPVPPGPLEILASCEVCDGLGPQLLQAQAGSPVRVSLPPEAVLEIELAGPQPGLAWARVVGWNDRPEGHPLVPQAASGLEEGSRVIRLGGLPAGRVIVEAGIDEREIRIVADLRAGAVTRKVVAAP